MPPEKACCTSPEWGPRTRHPLNNTVRCSSRRLRTHKSGHVNVAFPVLSQLVQLDHCILSPAPQKRFEGKRIKGESCIVSCGQDHPLLIAESITELHKAVRPKACEINKRDRT